MEICICTLLAQRDHLAETIRELEATAAAASTAGIREYRLTRLRQLQTEQATLLGRIRLLTNSPAGSVSQTSISA